MRKRNKSPTAEAAMYRFKGRKRRNTPARSANTNTAASRTKHVHQTRNSIEPGTYSLKLNYALVCPQLKSLSSGPFTSRATEVLAVQRSSRATGAQVLHRSSRVTEVLVPHRSSKAMAAQAL